VTEERQCRQYGHRTENYTTVQVQWLLRAGDRRDSFVPPTKDKRFFLFSIPTRQVAGPTLDNRGCFSGGVNRTSRETYNCHLVQESTMHEATCLLPHTSSWSDVQQARGHQTETWASIWTVPWNSKTGLAWCASSNDSVQDTRALCYRTL